MSRFCPAALAAIAFGALALAGMARLAPSTGSASQPPPVIHTVAGTGQDGYSGDGGPATSAKLSSAVGDVAYDAAGNLYIADNNNAVIRKVNTQGIISTIAGTGVAGNGADGVQALNSALDDPRGVAIDSVENLYIADRNNSKVRKVATNGIVSTFYATTAPDKVRVDASDNVFVLNGFAHTIVVLNSSGSVLRTAPGDFGDIAIAGDGAIIHADLTNLQVKRIDTGGHVTRLAGQTDGVPGFSGDGGPALAARFAGPFGVVIDTAGTVDQTGSIIVSDRENHRIRAIRPDGTIQTIAGDGTAGFCGEWSPAASSWLGDPSSLAFAPSGSLSFIDDARVRQLTVLTAPPPTPTSTPCPPTATPTPTSPLPTNTPTTSPFTLTPTPTLCPACPTPTPNCAQQTSPPIAACFTPTPAATMTATPGPDCSVLTSPPDAACVDSDGDGCRDGLEPLLVPPTDPNNAWDFYSVPVPPLFLAPNPLTDIRDHLVSASDAQAVFGYFKAAARAGTAVYDQDLDQNGLMDGRQYDRTVAGAGRSGAPDGVIAASDAQLAFAQFKLAYNCKR